MNCPCGQPAAVKGKCRPCYMAAWHRARSASPEPRVRGGIVTDKHRYPFANLERLLPVPDARNQYTDSVGHWESVLGVAYQQVDAWRKRGLSWRQADKLACRIGTHPGLVWPDWFERGFMDGRMDQEESAA